nr:retrovirus-related Pol polyprotein from transposon TNT 1-94 [Tanacetum cinerariifolium]
MHIVVWRNKSDLDSMSIDDLYNNLKLNLNGNKTVAFDKTKVECYNCYKRGHFTRECRAPRAQDNKNRESTRRNMPIKTTNSLALVSCKGLGGYDWSNQAEEGPNYALMAYSTSSSNFKKSELMVLGYKAGLKLVEERLEFFKTNESIYSEDIKKLKFEIHCNEITIRELRKKLETVPKEKHGIQLTIKKLENASKSLNKLIDSQIMDNYKKRIGYNAVPPPHTGLCMHPKPDLSYIGLEEFTSEPAVETLNAKTSKEVLKLVKKDNVALIIKDWKSDDEDESVPQPKIEKKTIKPSVAKRVNTIRNKHVNTARPKAIVNIARLKAVHNVVKDYKEINGGYVAFGGSPNGRKITGKDENHVLLRVPRKNNMYSVDLKNIIPKGGLTCLFAKDTSDESRLCKAFRVFNSRTRIVEETLHIKFSENTPNNVGSGPNWLFDIDALTKTMNYQPLLQSSQDAGFKPSNDVGKKVNEIPRQENECKDQKEKDSVNSTNRVNVVRLTLNAAGNEVNVGHTQEDGIDYDEVFATVARIEAIRLFLAYALFKEFVVYQMDVKSAFLYVKIEKDVYVCQPPGFKDPDFPNKVYKVEKVLYGLHQTPRALYETLSTYLFDNEFQKGKIDKTLFIRRHKGDILLVQVYVDDIIFGLQVKQKDEGIFIIQDKYIAEILKKFGFPKVKTASTPMETQKTLLKDEYGEEVDVHIYRSMIGSLIYCTSLRPDIMFTVCAGAR